MILAYNPENWVDIRKVKIGNFVQKKQMLDTKCLVKIEKINTFFFKLSDEFIELFKLLNSVYSKYKNIKLTLSISFLHVKLAKLCLSII